MGATKTLQYSNEFLKISKIADALGHPARLTIFKLLMDGEKIRQADLGKVLQLKRTSIQSHLRKMKDAQIIELEFLPTEYIIHLNQREVNQLHSFLTS